MTFLNMLLIVSGHFTSALSFRSVKIINFDSYSRENHKKVTTLKQNNEKLTLFLSCHCNCSISSKNNSLCRYNDETVKLVILNLNVVKTRFQNKGKCASQFSPKNSNKYAIVSRLQIFCLHYFLNRLLRPKRKKIGKQIEWIACFLFVYRKNLSWQCSRSIIRWQPVCNLIMLHLCIAVLFVQCLTCYLLFLVVCIATVFLLLFFCQHVYTVYV